MRKKKVIGVDLDDVLLDFNRALYAWHNTTYNTNFTYGDITTYFIEDVLHCTREEVFAKITEFYRTTEHTGAVPIPDALEGVKNLSQTHTLIVVTSKPDYLRPLTTAWLEKYFPQMFESIHFTNHFLGDESKRKLKSVVCRELGIDIFIEDGHVHALDVATVCETVFLLDRPWNQDVVAPPIVRVSSWDEIVQKLH